MIFQTLVDIFESFNEKFSVPEGRENDLLTVLGYIPVLCLFHLPFLSTLSSCYFLLLSRSLE